jgi:hypothetical protein
MASPRERVRLQGFLSGQGREARCLVWATKVSLPGGPIAYSRYEVDPASVNLPEGDYQLAVSNGGFFQICHEGGHWLSRGL